MGVEYAPVLGDGIVIFSFFFYLFLIVFRTLLELLLLAGSDYMLSLKD